MLDRCAPDVVAFAERSMGLDQKLRDDEHRDALRALGRAGKARKHEVDDILGKVVLAERNEDLRAVDLVVVAFGRRFRAHGCQIATGLRLCEGYSAPSPSRGAVL